MKVTQACQNYMNFRMRYIDIRESGNAEYTEMGANDQYLGYVSYAGTNTFDFIIKSVNFHNVGNTYDRGFYYTIPEIEDGNFVLYVNYLGALRYLSGVPSFACLATPYHMSGTTQTKTNILIWGYYNGRDPFTYAEDLNDPSKYLGYGDSKLHKFISSDGMNWSEVKIATGEEADRQALVWSFENYKNYVESENNKDYKIIEDDKEIQTRTGNQYESWFPMPYIVNSDKIISGKIIHYAFTEEEE